jgi:ribose transport system ATP-binding protein
LRKSHNPVNVKTTKNIVLKLGGELMSDFLLEARNICKEFPGVKSLDDVSFGVYEGEVHGLVGENGAGKSTLIKILTGAYTADSGEIYLNGERIIINTPATAQIHGITAVYQELSLISVFSVAENIFLGNEQICRPVPIIKWDYIYNRGQELIDYLGIKLDAKKTINEITIGERQMVEVAKAIARKAKIIIMDEPTAPLSDKEVDALFKFIKSVREKKITIIYISHRLEEIFKITDNITILKDGKKVGTYPTKEITKDTIVNKMTGRETATRYYKEKIEIGAELLRTDHVNKKKQVKDITFKLNKGEVIGFFGLVGSGRTEVMRILFGAQAKDSGTITVNGKQVDIHSCKQAIKNGICLVPEERKAQGLVLDMSVKENITLSCLEFLKRLGMFINNKKERDVADDSISRLAIKTPKMNTPVKYLSGGNQQKVVIARWLNTHSEIIIMDEPTKGIDIGAKVEIYHIITNLVKNHKGVIVVSSELPEIMAISDRIYVMREGVIVGEVPREEATQEKILKLALIGSLD